MGSEGDVASEEAAGGAFSVAAGSEEAAGGAFSVAAASEEAAGGAFSIAAGSEEAAGGACSVAASSEEAAGGASSAAGASGSAVDVIDGPLRRSQTCTNPRSSASPAWLAASAGWCVRGGLRLALGGLAVS